jgi:phenylacetate-CoA ligase
MPLLRYRTGDLTTVLDSPCPCGRTHRRIARIKGRSDDMMIVRGVNVFPRQIESVLMSLPEVGTNYVIRLTRDKGLDVMTVEVELQRGDCLDSGDSLITLQKRIQQELKREVLVTPVVKLVQQGTLPPSEGKARRVVDDRDI